MHLIAIYSEYIQYSGVYMSKSDRDMDITRNINLYHFVMFFGGVPGMYQFCHIPPRFLPYNQALVSTAERVTFVVTYLVPGTWYKVFSSPACCSRRKKPCFMTRASTAAVYMH